MFDYHIRIGFALCSIDEYRGSKRLKSLTQLNDLLQNFFHEVCWSSRYLNPKEDAWLR
jgi:hypothetical protein